MSAPRTKEGKISDHFKLCLVNKQLLNIVFLVDIEAHALELQRQKKAENTVVSEEDKVGLGKLGGFDSEIFGASNKFEGYYDSIAPNEEADVSYFLIV